MAARGSDGSAGLAGLSGGLSSPPVAAARNTESPRSRSLPSTQVAVLQRNGVVFYGDPEHLSLDTAARTVGILPQWEHLYPELLKANARVELAQQAALARAERTRRSPAWRAAFEARNGRPYVPAQPPPPPPAAPPPVVLPPLEPTWDVKPRATFAASALQQPTYLAILDHAGSVANADEVKRNFVASFTAAQMSLLGRELASAGRDLPFVAAEDELVVKAALLLRHDPPSEFSQMAHMAMWLLPGFPDGGIAGFITHGRTAAAIRERYAAGEGVVSLLSVVCARALCSLVPNVSPVSAHLCRPRFSRWAVILASWRSGGGAWPAGYEHLAEYAADMPTLLARYGNSHRLASPAAAGEPQKPSAGEPKEAAAGGKHVTHEQKGEEAQAAAEGVQGTASSLGGRASPQTGSGAASGAARQRGRARDRRAALSGGGG